MKRALLVAGGISQKISHRRYRNDLLLFFRALTEVHGYGEDAIRVLLGLGGSPMTPGSARCRPATRLEIHEGLAWLRELGSADSLFVVASNHGSPDGLCLWGSEIVTPSEFEACLVGCDASKVLIFGQCYAGVFCAMRLARAVVCSAAGAKEPSWACTLDGHRVAPEYDEFLYHFAAAMSGSYPNGMPCCETIPPPPQLSVKQAFEYARKFDRQPETPQISDPELLASLLTF
jgi:hypothetical protein